MAATCSVCVVLFHLAGVIRIECNSRLMDLVDGLVLLYDVAITLVCDQVLRAGALSLTVGMACAYRLLRTLFIVIV